MKSQLRCLKEFQLSFEICDVSIHFQNLLFNSMRCSKFEFHNYVFFYETFRKCLTELVCRFKLTCCLNDEQRCRNEFFFYDCKSFASLFHLINLVCFFIQIFFHSNRNFVDMSIVFFFRVSCFYHVDAKFDDVHQLFKFQEKLIQVKKFLYIDNQTI